MFEKLQQYATKEKIDVCWRCGTKLDIYAYNGSDRYPEIVCSKCGFIIEITSKVNNLIGYMILISLLFFVLGLLVSSLRF